MNKRHEGDTYNVSGQAGAVGRNSTAIGNVFNQAWTDSSTHTDLDELAAELASLRTTLAERAQTAEDYEVVGVVASAERSARGHDGPAALQLLSKGGKAALSVANEIGTRLAAEMIRTALHAAGVPLT